MGVTRRIGFGLWMLAGLAQLTPAQVLHTGISANQVLQGKISSDSVGTGQTQGSCQQLASSADPNKYALITNHSPMNPPPKDWVVLGQAGGMYCYLQPIAQVPGVSSSVVPINDIYSGKCNRYAVDEFD